MASTSSSAPIEFYGFWRSIASFRVRTALRLKGLSAEERVIDLLKGEQHSDAFDKINPGHAIPALLSDGAILTQSLAIMEYLDEVYPEPSLMPKTPIDRAYARALALVAVADTHPLVVPRIRHKLAAMGHDEAAVMSWCNHWTHEGVKTYESLLARRPAAPFALGATVGIADICIASLSVQAHFFKVDLAPYPHVATLAKLCFELPAFAESHPLKQPGAPQG